MFKVGSWFVFKTGDSYWGRKPLQVKAITNKKDKVRTFRAIGGLMWIETRLIRPATDEEVRLNERIDN